MAEPLSDDQIETRLNELNASASGEKWSVRDGKLTKRFVFKDFVQAFGFMTQAAIHAQSMDHHPEWLNVYKKVDVRLATHEAGGITDLDFELAGRMESVAA
ncbi:MAG: 4a-hydroxytetrahydrobiopterin dehydratase [Chromatiales bacterium]|jgi:4a-hydroxytetrahydrobiopterin dehydratase